MTATTATTTASSTARITLYYREGSSDKVYQAAIEPKGASSTFVMGKGVAIELNRFRNDT